MKNVTHEVNKVYSEQNPSVYFRNESQIPAFIENGKNFLLQLKIPPRSFLNSKLIDFGCGSGQKSLVYDHLGADCTLVEYDKQSYTNALALFEGHALNSYRVVNSDIFDFEFPSESFDFALSMGVAHHTKDPAKNIEICCNSLKPGGMLIFGIGNKAGFFQRNLQRLILYAVSENKEDIIKYSKILYKEHLKRSAEFGGRSLDEIVYDTYINPKIYTFGTSEVIEEFAKNKLSLYSSYRDLKNIQQFLEPSINNFQLMINQKSNFTSQKDVETINFSDFEDLSLSNNDLSNSKCFEQFHSLIPHFNAITDEVNDLNFDSFDIDGEKLISELSEYKEKIINIDKIDLINKRHNEVFIDEVSSVIKILNKNIKKKDKFNEIHKALNKSVRLFQLVNGVGMNYYCGYKNE
jgi:SAM-dependent methyltransferase